MAKHLVMIGRLAVSGMERVEVGNWLIECALIGARDPRIEDILHVPISRTPTPVARNVLVQTAKENRVDIIFMADEDMGIPEGFFSTALEFLIRHQGPACIGIPYCTAPPREDVLAFEWAGRESGSPGHAWAVANITREDAARRSGVEKVANLGTGCIAYKMECFDILKPPYYDYGYNDDHTAVIETEDCFLHRRLWFAGVPLYVDWDHWASHYKTKRVGKPVPVAREDVLRAFRSQADTDQRRELATAKPVDPITQADGYAARAERVIPQPELTPQREPFTPDISVRFAQSIEGWMAEEELLWLAQQASSLPSGGVWVECGVWKGRSLSAVALAATPGSRVLAIDTWCGSPNERETAHHEATDPGDRVFKQFMQTLQLLDRLRSGAVDLSAWRQPITPADRLKDRQADVVFLDGSHDYESVAADLRSWEPKVNPGGMLCGHDCGMESVRVALAQWSAESGIPVENAPGSLWFARIPPQGASEASSERSERNGCCPVASEFNGKEKVEHACTADP